MTQPPDNHSTPQSARVAARRRASWLRVLAGVFVFVLIGLAALVYIAGSPMNAVRLLGLGSTYVKDRVLQAPPFHGKTQVNVLMLGTDVSFGACSRTDSMKMISVNTKTERMAILSIPRDIWVMLPNGKEGRINGAYSLGGRNSYQGTANARLVVQRLLSDVAGTPIHLDYFLRFQLDRCAGLIDALGGIDLNVEKQMDYDDPSQDLHIHLLPGWQHLGGEQAMNYVRFRHDAESDFGRMRRQDQLIRAIVAAMSDPHKGYQLTALAPLMRFVATDLSINDVRGNETSREQKGYGRHLYRATPRGAGAERRS